MAANGTFAAQEQLKASADQVSATEASSAGSNNNNLSKDEVGWYFVEQYYTTLSKTPEKLHLFYGKRSQFVYGKEAEVAAVSVGRAAIQERIKELDFQDCKVRVTNVDSMASGENIVIQAIGETSNKSPEPKKFVQTFVLAPQPHGYFVVNDILRFINEEGEEESAETQAETATANEASAPAELEAKTEAVETAADDAVVDANAVDKKLEEVPAASEVATATVNGPVGVAIPETKAEEPAAKAENAATETTADPDTTAQQLADEDLKTSEKPAEPSPTPVAPVQQAEKPAPAPVPAKPMSWASRAAAAVGAPKPVVALPKTATPPAQNKSAAPAPAAATPPPAVSQQQQPPTSAPAQPAAESKESPQSASEWQSVTDSKRQNRPQSISGPPSENTPGYVKYVTDKVKTEDLRAALASHGELTYFDVNRQKNCAFVEFATVSGYQAAVAANPHVVNGENIVVEQRRPKAGAYGGSNYGAGRGNAMNRPRGGYDGQRNGSQGSTRGNFAGQGRGRGAPRGRGASQAANA